MKRFMLISVGDREIDPPRFFETAEEAQSVMYKEFADCMEIEVTEAIEKYMDNEDWEDDAQITDDCAAAYAHHTCVDWQIFDLSLYNP